MHVDVSYFQSEFGLPECLSDKKATRGKSVLVPHAFEPVHYLVSFLNIRDR